MKVGEVYHNRFNNYDSTILNISNKEITLKAVNSGVVENTKIEHFNLNWFKKYSIAMFEAPIRKYFKQPILVTDSSIAIVADGGWVSFSIEGDTLVAKFADVTKRQLKLDDSELAFNIFDYEEVIKIIAGLFTD